jgi:hypothetical protein
MAEEAERETMKMNKKNLKSLSNPNSHSLKTALALRSGGKVADDVGLVERAVRRGRAQSREFGLKRSDGGLKGSDSGFLGTERGFGALGESDGVLTGSLRVGQEGLAGLQGLSVLVRVTTIMVIIMMLIII